MREFEESENAPKRVGVFGAPKRGKSTLINALLGHEILPTSPVPLSTTTIEIERDAALAGWEVTVDLDTGRVDTQTLESERSVASLLENLGSRRGATTATRLRVKGRFENCSILNHGGVLIDTPGAEFAFEQDAQLKAETEKAVQALEKTHVVLFCTRADQIESRSDVAFYEQHTRQFDPLHIITMKDKWNGEQGELLDEAMRQYGVFKPKSILSVCATDALNARVTGTDLRRSGLPELEERVLDELKRLTPKLGMSTCLLDFSKLIGEDKTLRPERVYFDNLHAALDQGGAVFDNARKVVKDVFWRSS
jgi:tRNA U34 5-carboxymethylaminomethyl modifying GTPase MnmE/TrmE